MRFRAKDSTIREKNRTAASQSRCKDNQWFQKERKNQILIKNQINENMNLQKIQSLSNAYNIITMYKIKLKLSVSLLYLSIIEFLTFWRNLEKGVIPFTSRGNEFQSISKTQHQKNKENEEHIVWSGLGLESGYHYFIDGE